jgi:sporulation protein YlmC with PRC-barrel domain
MSDPQDLLYTNQFIATNVLSNAEVEEGTKYYDRFKDYLSGTEKDQTERYIDNDGAESDPVNRQKILNTKWPIYGNRNHYPLFDKYINDISVNRYKKEIISKVSIDTKNRDISKYLNSNDFNIPFNKVYSNIKKFEINDIVFSNVNQSVTYENNNLSWQYASQNYLLGANIDNTIIPVPNPNLRISYSSLPNSVYSFQISGGYSIIPGIDDYLVYQATIAPGYYTVDTLQENIRLETSSVLHGSNIAGVNLNIIEEPYLVYGKRIGTPHLFTTFIEPISSVVRFVNRMEEIAIIAIQTFSPYETDYRNNDIFHFLSSVYQSGNQNQILNNDYIYVTLETITDLTDQYFENIFCTNSPNAFPLVITGLDLDVGNIDFNLINFTEFYDENIYTKHGYEIGQINSISTYKFIDYIQIINPTTYITDLTGQGAPTTKVFVKTYLRFALKLSTGNLNGKNYDSIGQIVIPSITQNIVFSESLNNYLNNTGNLGTAYPLYATVNTNSSTTNPYNVYFNYNDTAHPVSTSKAGQTSGFLTEFNYYDRTVLIGRALLFRFIFDKVNGTYTNYETSTANEKKRSVLNVLAWPIANQTLQVYTLETNNGFKFIQSNIQSSVVNNQTISTYQVIPKNNLPSLNIHVQYFANKYYIVENFYIYLKLLFNTNDSLLSPDQIINAVSYNVLLYNQNYIDGTLFNVGIGEDYTCAGNISNLTIRKKDYSNIFAKIILSDVPGNYDTILSNTSKDTFSINYDNVIDNISGVTVQAYDSNMKLLTVNDNFSFTLTIYQIKDVLKETLINTKTNNVNTEGYFF